MVNVETRTLVEPDGTPVTNVAFDLSADQLAAVSYALGEVLLERHRGATLDTDGVLALRELTGIRDEIDRLASAGGHARVLLPLARYIALHDALDEWVTTRTARGWHRAADDEAMPLLRAMLGPLESLRAEALAAALGAETRSH
jgi:plasmid stability protein